MENKKTRKKLSKPTLITIIIVAVLVVGFAIFLPLYLNSNKENRELYDYNKIVFYDGTMLVGEFDFDTLKEMSEYKTFDAVYDTSTTSAQNKTYSGIELLPIIKAMDIDLEDKTCVRFSASDGINRVYSIEDIKKENNVFIADKVNGEPFIRGIDSSRDKTKYEDGGPYVVIKTSDLFSQNRVKLLVKVEIL